MTHDAVEKPEVMSSREALTLLTDERARQAHPFLVERALAAVVAHEARAACWHGAAELARADADAAEGRRALERSDREEAHALALAAERARVAEAEALVAEAETRARVAEREALRAEPFRRECEALRARVAELEAQLDLAARGEGPDADARVAHWQGEAKALHAASLEVQRKLLARNAEVDARKARLVGLMRLLAVAPASEAVCVNLRLGKYTQITAAVAGDGAGIQRTLVTGYVANCADAGAPLADCLDAAIVEARRLLRGRVGTAQAVLESEAVREMLGKEAGSR